MGTPKRRQSHRAGRGPIRSPGRPTAGRRDQRQEFWKAIARGLPSQDAALAVGVSAPITSPHSPFNRWLFIRIPRDVMFLDSGTSSITYRTRGAFRHPP